MLDNNSNSYVLDMRDNNITSNSSAKASLGMVQ